MIKHLNKIFFLKFFESCYFHLDCLKIKLFSRLINLIDSLENDECNFFLSSFKFFDER